MHCLPPSLSLSLSLPLEQPYEHWKSHKILHICVSVSVSVCGASPARQSRPVTLRVPADAAPAPGSGNGSRSIRPPHPPRASLHRFLPRPPPLPPALLTRSTHARRSRLGGQPRRLRLPRRPLVSVRWPRQCPRRRAGCRS